VVRVLINAGADINAHKEDGATALIFAASMSEGEIVTALLAAGAEVGLETNDGGTALSAADSGDIKQLLREAG
jgi:uncharacterized protein